MRGKTEAETGAQTPFQSRTAQPMGRRVCRACGPHEVRTGQDRYSEWPKGFHWLHNKRDWKRRAKVPFIPSAVSSFCMIAVVVVQSLSHIQLLATPWTAERQASLSICLLYTTVLNQLHIFGYSALMGCCFFFQRLNLDSLWEHRWVTRLG